MTLRCAHHSLTWICHKSAHKVVIWELGFSSSLSFGFLPGCSRLQGESSRIKLLTENDDLYLSQVTSD